MLLSLTKTWKLCSIFILLTKDISCLRNVHLIAPEAAVRGSRVVMKCIYDLEKDVLYTVKWYRGEKEFCRYSPRDVPPLKIFPIEGIDVDPQATDAQQVTIKEATEVAQGRFVCEVSADAPSFQTLQVRAHMYVVDVPKSYPSLFGMKRSYRPGSKLEVECVSYSSQPPANLSFFINDERAKKEKIFYNVKAEDNGNLWTSCSTLQFTVQRQHFIDGKLRIRCTSIIYSAYAKSVEISAEAERVRPTRANLNIDDDIRGKIIIPVHHVSNPSTSGFQNLSPSLITISRINLLLFILILYIIF